MKQLYMREKIVSLRGKFTIKDERGNDIYFVTGSFLKIPKSFHITNTKQQEIGIITKKMISILPKFFVEVNGKEVLTIRKDISLFKARYSIDGAGIEVRGNWWDLNFQVYQHGEPVGAVSKKLLSWGDNYEIQVLKEDFEEILISLVVAIDCVKEDSDSASS